MVQSPKSNASYNPDSLTVYPRSRFPGGRPPSLPSVSFPVTNVNRMCANPLLLDPHDHCHVPEERNCPRRAPASPGPSRRGRISDSCSAFTVTTEPRSPPPAWELLSSPCARFRGRRGSCQRSGVALGNGSHPSCRFRPLPRRPLSAALRLCVSRLFSSLCHVVNCAPCGFLLRTGSQTLPSASLPSHGSVSCCFLPEVQIPWPGRFRRARKMEWSLYRGFLCID